MSAEQQDKIKVVDIFHGAPVSQNSGNSPSLTINKLEFEKGVILNAINPNYGKNLKSEEVEKENEKKKEKEKRNSIIFREQCEYCLTRFSVSGHLILTKESLLFEPDLRDQNVINNGYGTYQIFIDLYDIYECAHIVVPTKDTYLCISDETCGFVQVLLKNKYQKTVPENETNALTNTTTTTNNNNNATNAATATTTVAHIKKTAPENDTNKNKGVSYYKYISKSLSFVYNLAQPLVHSSASKESIGKDTKHIKDETQQVATTSMPSNEPSSTTEEIEKSTDSYKGDIGGIREFLNTNIKNGKEVKTSSSNGVSVISNSNISSPEETSSSKINLTPSNNALSSNTVLQNEECTNGHCHPRSRKGSLLNFDGDAKKNVVKHLKDNDLKIYQKINQTHYADVSGTLPAITYKNNLSTLYSQSISKDSSFSDIDFNTEDIKEFVKDEDERDDEGEEKRGEKEKNQMKTNPKHQKQRECENQNNSAQKFRGSIDDTFQLYSDSESKKTQNEVNKMFNEMSSHLKKENEVKLKTAHNTWSNNNSNKNNNNDNNNNNNNSTESSMSNEKKNTCNKSNKNTILNMSEVVSANNKITATQHASVDKEKRHYPETDTSHASDLSKPKRYEERSFVLFRFFNNSRAYETTLKIIKEIDEVRKSGKKMNKTITSVPFSSNELLKYIIEQSLKKKENSQLKAPNSQVNRNRNDSNMNSQNNSYILGSNNVKEQKYQVIEPKLEYINGAVKLLTKHMSKQINYYLPPTISIKIWKLAFCTSIHGVSFKTLYRSVKNKGCVLLIIYDMNDILFGYFTDQLNCDNCYYGSGENFLFTFLTDDDVKKKEKRKQETASIKKEQGKEMETPSNYNLTKKYFSLTHKNLNEELSEKTERIRKTASEQDETNSKKSQDSSSNATGSINKCIKDMTHSKLSKIHNSLIFSRVHSAVGNIRKHREQKNIENTNKENEAKQEINQEIKQETKEKNHAENNAEKYKSIKVYPWTSKNNYFIYSDEKSIMVGGGDNYALIINEDLCKGQTNKSCTYDNELLTLDEEFDIQFLQLWVFQDYTFDSGSLLLFDIMIFFKNF